MEESKSLMNDFKASGYSIQMSQPARNDQEHVDPSGENYNLKSEYFFEFFLYYATELILGPFSVIVFYFIPNGLITADNLKITTKNCRYICSSFMIYILRVFFVFFAIFDGSTWKEFFTLLFTEITLIVLFSTYYSTFRASEIIKFKTIPNYNKSSKNDMIEIFDHLLDSSKEKFYQRDTIKREFSEIDFNTFYFYVRTGTSPVLEAQMKEFLGKHPEVRTTIRLLPQYEDCNIIDGLLFTNYIVNLCDNSKEIKRKTMIAKIFSRLLVLSRFIFPFVEDILNNTTFAHFQNYDYVMYILAMLCMAILVFRASITYDTIFLGLISYLFKLKLLMASNNLLKDGCKDQIYPFIPENFESWYAMRRILARLNAQFYSLVDTVISFIVLFILVDAIYIIVSAMLEISHYFIDYILKDPSFKIIIDQNKLVILVVLYYGLKVGYQINEYYDYDRAALTKLKDMMNQINSYTYLYTQNLDVIKDKAAPRGPKDKYPDLIMSLIKMLGVDNFEEKFKMHTAKLSSEITFVINQLQYEAKNFPHTLLGFQTNEHLVLNILTVIGLFGISSAKDFI